MEPSGGEVAAKRAKPSAGGGGDGEDLLSALSDDVLILILVRLRSAAAAGRTSVLSRRWRRLWALLPELRFPVAPEPPHRLRAALEAHEAPLRFLLVGARGAAPDAVAAWLPAAARRLSGFLMFVNLEAADGGGGGGEVEAGESGFVELPCFENATEIGLTLGFLGLAVPPAGVFARLTELSLKRVRFEGPRELGDAVSSPRCPSVQRLRVHNARGLANLCIHSESLLHLNLRNLEGLQQLTVVAPALEELELSNCFAQNQPVADISTPQLSSLGWNDSYEPSSVQFGTMAQLQVLMASSFLVYGTHDSRNNRAILKLLERFPIIRALHLTLAYRQGIGNFQYLMEDLVLPRHMYLSLNIINNGHAFGASFFHVLRMSPGLKGFLLMLDTDSDFEAQSACPSGCICDEPMNWRTEDLTLNCLEEVEIDMSGADHEVAFLKRLFSWATVLKSMMITFDYSISESKVRELRQTVSRFSRPEICLEFYMYHDGSKKSWYLLAPEDHGNGL